MNMAYIDIDYYRNDFMGVEVPDDTALQRLINRASRDIDVLTRFNITDFENMHVSIQDKIKLATASQVEFLVEYGETASSMGESSGGGFSIGSYSEQKGSSASSWSGRYASSVLDYLLATGLLYRGVAAWDGGPCG
jgi:hypothetical protein